MNKRRKKLPLIEEIDFDDVFSESQKEELLKSNKRQKTAESCFSEAANGSISTDDEQSAVKQSACAPNDQNILRATL